MTSPVKLEQERWRTCALSHLSNAEMFSSTFYEEMELAASCVRSLLAVRRRHGIGCVREADVLGGIEDMLVCIRRCVETDEYLPTLWQRSLKRVRELQDLLEVIK
jgi:hypothetical protein